MKTITSWMIIIFDGNVVNASIQWLYYQWSHSPVTKEKSHSMKGVVFYIDIYFYVYLLLYQLYTEISAMRWLH